MVHYYNVRNVDSQEDAFSGTMDVAKPNKRCDNVSMHVQTTEQDVVVIRETLKVHHLLWSFVTDVTELKPS